MKEVSFEPMTVGRILDCTFKIYRENFVHFVAIVAVVVIPVQLLLLLSQGIMFGDTLQSGPGTEWSVSDTDTEHEEYIYEQNDDFHPAIMALGFAGMMIAFILIVIGQQLSQGALAHSVSKGYLGDVVTVGQAYRYVGKRIFRILGAAVLVGLIVWAGFLLFVVPGILFLLWYALVVPVIIVEDCSISEALSRSKALVRGNKGKVLLLGGVVWLISMVVQIPFQVVGNLSSFWIINVNAALGLMLSQVSEMIGQIIVAPISAAAFILLYYDLRIRKEGFDLEMLAKETYGDHDGNTPLVE